LYETEQAVEPVEEPSIDRVVTAVPPPIPTVREAVINFGNKTAVGVSIMVAALTLFLLIVLILAVPPSRVLCPLVFCAGGYLAATVYVRASGETLSPQNGARMGFMTCLWAFLVVLAFMAITVLSMSNPDVRQSWHQQVQQMQQAQTTPELAQTIKVLEDPAEFVKYMLLGSALLFCGWTLLSMLGGILGARFSARRPTGR
jgi:hypothetical protein